LAGNGLLSSANLLTNSAAKWCTSALVDAFTLFVSVDDVSTALENSLRHLIIGKQLTFGLCGSFQLF